MKKCLECENLLKGQQNKFCSNACKQRNHWKRVKTQPNTYHSQTLRGYRRKMILIEYFGGCCQNCGYDKNLAALEFHHLYNKSFQLDLRTLSNNSLEVLFEESKKCKLLCSNCHKELHNPEMLKENISKIIGDSLEKSNDVKWINSVKPKLTNMVIPSQAGDASSEGVETSGGV